MDSIIIKFLTVLLLFLLLLFSFYLKKVLFFETMNSRVKKITKILIAVFFVCLLIVIPVYQISPPNHRLYTLSTMYSLFLIVLAYALLFVSSYISRKERKWMAIFIPVPLIVFSLSIYNLSQVILAVIKTKLGLLYSSAFFLVPFFAVFMLILAIVRKIKGSVLYNLELYIEDKKLSFKEELSIFGASFILIGGNVLGYVTFDRPLVRASILAYGFITAIVILYTVYNRNLRMYTAMKNQQLQKTLITTMADLVDNRDENTGGHIRRTAKYVEVIAREMKQEKVYSKVLTDKYVKDMIVAAPLHDIGKIHVPDNILNKPGRYEPQEFEIMKTHTSEGYNLLCQIEKKTGDIAYIQVAKHMARYHHEWLNGKGYPDGLMEEDIPLCARIMAVADVFDALVSKRVYKDPMPLEKAYEILRQESGSHFDPVVVEAFFNAREKIENVLKEEE